MVEKLTNFGETCAKPAPVATYSANIESTVTSCSLYANIFTYTVYLFYIGSVAVLRAIAPKFHFDVNLNDKLSLSEVFN